MNFKGRRRACEGELFSVPKRDNISTIRERLSALSLEHPGWYYIRSITLLAGVATLAIIALARHTDRLQLIVENLYQLNELHDLFYALLPTAGLLLFFPRLRFLSSQNRIVLVFVAFLTGYCSGALIRRALPFSRLQPEIIDFIKLDIFLLELNVVGFVIFHCDERLLMKARKVIINLPFVSDVLFPAVLWTAYNQGNRTWMAPGRMALALSMYVAVFLPLVAHPLLNSDSIYLDTSIAQVMGGENFYQLIVEPQSETLFVMIERREVMKVYLAQVAVPAKTAIDSGLQSMGLDKLHRRLIFVNPQFGSAIEIDMDDLSTERQIGFVAAENRQNPYVDLWRTIYDRQRKQLLSYTYGGAFLYDSDAYQVKAERSAWLTDVLLDEERGELHSLESDPNGYSNLVALDAGTLDVRRVLQIPKYTERLVLDEKRDRLIITFPISGRLLVVDSGTYKPIAWIDSFPGVRTLGIDRSADLLIAGGLSPLIEVRSLEDFSLIRRIRGPCWSRWIAVDELHRRVYISTRDSGLWCLYLNRISSNEIQRFDIFYPLVNMTCRAVSSIVGF